MRGIADRGVGAAGFSLTWHGVYGESKSEIGGAGVWGEHKAKGAGTVGKSVEGVGVWGESETYEGIHAVTRSPTTAAIAAYNDNPSGTGAAIFAKKKGSVGHAGFFVGNVEVTGSLTVQGVSIQTLLQRISSLEQRNSSLEQKVNTLQNQLNTAISNLTGRMTAAEVEIRGLRQISHTHSI
ncbi:MAG: hypothetical protein GXX12_01350 [Methanosarcina thermophila]|uniref:Uncharacterized protein n=2 Tax=Methanosarcina thermophila TaxID=2210 RepID=A0A0E3NCG1_METTE|nr:hypothetical protein [Methanosarcina thermophila]AKB15238.1 hypothetical protein MSTHC_0920 [Methanosarcina thermophila CHTI-55]NLU56112.1 hypothetical protein [Methanosarcina thermophila]BAW29164.1 conserved hypothetical protein [Methanosarcina thermophila]